MTDFLKSAKRARAAGDLEGAGDLFLLAGRPQDAVATFMEGHYYGRAAQILESQGSLRDAAALFEKAGEHLKAAELFEGIGELERAATHYESAGEHYRAAQLAERTGETLQAARLYEKVGDLERGAQLFLDGGEARRAAELYEELWLNRDREDPRHRVRSLLAPERIAEMAGRSFSRAGDSERAASFYSRAGLHELAADAYAQASDPLRAARSYRKAGQVPRAIELLEQSDLSADGAELLAELYVEAKEPLKAGEAFEQAGRLREAGEIFERAGHHLRAASLFALLGDKRRAAGLFHQAGDHASAARAYEEAGLLESAATAYEESGNVRRAADLARRLHLNLKAKPQPGGRPRLLAMGKRAADLMLAAGDAEHAAELYAELGLARDSARLFQQLGKPARAADQLALLGEHGAARDLYLQAGVPVPPEIEGGALESAERFGEAAEVFERAGELERAARLYSKAGRGDQSGRIFEKMDDHVRAAECFESAGDHRKAGQLFQKAGLLDRAAECLERSGDLERAAYVHLLAENFLAAADAFIQAKKPDDAVVLLQKMKPGHDDYLTACLRLGDIFFAKGLYSLALDKYFKALAERSTDETLLPPLYNLAITYEHLERWGEARECYDRIMSVDFGFRDARARRQATVDAERKLATDTPGPVIAPGPVETSTRFEVKGSMETDELGILSRAWDHGNQRPVMLRRLTAADLDASKADRLVREARGSANLQHANILAVYEAGDENGVRFVAMEYVEATTLRSRFDAGERFDPYRAADIAAQVAMALDHAHRAGVLHRNLRPETILILSSGDVVKVRDFGFADRLTDTLKASGGRRHPLSYMAPEQILGRKIDERSDIYALGVVLYELFFGQPPFTGDDIIYQHVSRPVTLPKDGPVVAERFRRLVMRCLEKDPGRRWQRAREIADELRRAEVEPGTLIEGRYEVQAEVGSGGMGKVYRAWDRELDETVALKILKAEFGENSEALSRFLREIKLSRKISHPNVVKVYDMGRFRGSRFISMEFIQGPSLEQWIRERKRIEIAPALKVVVPLLSALQAAHELGIVHRDVKPQNVLLLGGTVPKIVDFGIARGVNTEGVTLSGEVLGSPKYMAPEHIEEGVLDRRADLYAMGVLTYLLLTGREPFLGENPTSILLKHIHEQPKSPRTLNPEIPTWLEGVVLKCLAKDPDRRYQWASEIIVDIESH